MTDRLQVTTPEALPEETSADAALRPSRLDEFIGQAQVKASLQIAIDAARRRGESLDHTLFFGPPGLGKTTLAMLMAREMGVQLRTSSGPVLEKPGDLVGLLTSLGKGDILFIDEIHRLRPAMEEFLYPAMEDYRVDIRIARRAQRADDSDGPRALHADRRYHAVRPAHAADARPLRAGGASRAFIRVRSSSRSSPVRRRFSTCRSRRKARKKSPGAAEERRAWPTACSGGCATTRR